MNIQSVFSLKLDYKSTYNVHVQCNVQWNSTNAYMYIIGHMMKHVTVHACMDGGV